MSLAIIDAQLEEELAAWTIQKSQVSFPFVHGWALAVAWCLFGSLQIMTARYFKHKWQFNMLAHTAIGSLITFTTLFWGFIYVYRVAEPGQFLAPGRGPGQTKGLHSYSGFAMPVSIMVITITGFIPYFRRWQAIDNATQLMRLRDLHKVSTG